MAEPFLSEIRMFGFNFAPRGWATCSGQILPINQNQSLYSLLGTTYGGDGRTSFALPDLRGRSPRLAANGEQLGQKTGTETVTIDETTMPAHTHGMQVADASNQGTPTNNFISSGGGATTYRTPAGAALVDMTADTVSAVGGSQSHNNMQPYLTVNFCIALQGVFPSRN
jgi:microcystin-dependent protein